MREDEHVTEEGDDFEVYERKKPRPDLRPGNAPDTSRGGSGTDTHPDDPEPEPAEAEAAPDAWLSAPPPEASDPPPEHEDLHDDPRPEPLDRFFARPHAADPSMLPDPPAEPMRVEDAVPDAPTEPTAPVSTTAPAHASSQSSRSAPSRGDTMRIAIAATEFNYDITHMMIERARAHAEFLGASIHHVVRVPGVYDLPLAVKRLLARGDIDAVVTLGVVIEGETDHDDLVIQHAARKIVDLSLEHDKPVGLGITGPGMSRLQAEARIDRAKDAVEACVKLHRTLASL